MLDILWEILSLPFAVLWLAILGAVVGAIARFVLPGRDDMSLLATAIIGAIGSLLAGVIGALVGGNVHSTVLFIPRAGFFSSILGAIVALLLYRGYRNTSS